MSYKTIRSRAEASFIEKKSEFIGYISPATTEEEAVGFINEIRAMHRKATHNCYAYILRNNNTARHSDDGEPGGTAGMPIFDVLSKNGITDAVCVVTRYFGGILLGTGGLVRAYSQGAKVALEAGNVVMMQSCLMCEARCSYNQYGKVSSLIMEIGAVIDDTVYEADVLIKFHIKPELLDKLNKQLADATSGEIQAVSDSEKYFMSDTEK